MSDIHIAPPRGPWQLLQVYQLYRHAFPRSERKPFAIIRRMARQGRSDLWRCEADGRFAGLAATINSPSLILLDYLAIHPRLRDQGYGSAAMQALLRHYGELPLFVEIEAVEGDQADEKLRRRQFYQRCGLSPLGVSALVFGVPMELLGRGCTLTFEDYRRFYHDHYSSWAAEHILPRD